MAETFKTEAEILAAAPVGVREGITAQDYRDMVYSLLRSQYWLPTEPTEAPTTAGSVYWMDNNLNVAMGSGVVRQLGEELQTPLCRNNTGSLIPNGAVVHVAGSQGQSPTIVLATGAQFPIGVATQDIADGTSGYVTTFGVVRGLDTSSWDEGTVLWLGSAGTMTDTKPSGIGDAIYIGVVIRSNPTVGEVLVAIHADRPVISQCGIHEARPLISSTDFSDLYVWGWTDLTFPASTGAAQLAWTFEAYRDTGYRMAFFRHDQDDEMHMAIQMRHEWAGTAVSLHLHTIPMAAGSGNVYWTGSYSWGQVGSVLPSASSWTPIAAATPLLSGNQYQETIASIATIDPPAAPGHSDMLHVVIRREGTNVLDTYSTNKDHGTQAANLGVTSYDVHYQRTAAGSRGLYTGTITDSPAQVLCDRSQFPANSSIYIQIACRSTLGNEVEFRLWDHTAGEVVNGTGTTTSTDWTLIELGPLTLASAIHEYHVQGRYTGTADEPVFASSRFVSR